MADLMLFTCEMHPKKDAPEVLFEDYWGRFIRHSRVLSIAQASHHNLRHEGEALSVAFLQKIKSGAAGQAFIFLEEGGKEYTTPLFLDAFVNWTRQSPSLCFVIGGAYGFPPAMQAMPHHKLSLGRMTWPHRFAKFLLAEQLYRIAMLAGGHPYHHV